MKLPFLAYLSDDLLVDRSGQGSKCCGRSRLGPLCNNPFVDHKPFFCMAPIVKKKKNECYLAPPVLFFPIRDSSFLAFKASDSFTGAQSRQALVVKRYGKVADTEPKQPN
jgi:hypothetical protein